MLPSAFTNHENRPARTTDPVGTSIDRPDEANLLDISGGNQSKLANSAEANAVQIDLTLGSRSEIDFGHQKERMLPIDRIVCRRRVRVGDLRFGHYTE